MSVRPVLRAYSSACEHLLFIRDTLTDEERSFIEYYVNELSRELFSDKPTVETITAERS